MTSSLMTLAVVTSLYYGFTVNFTWFYMFFFLLIGYQLGSSKLFGPFDTRLRKLITISSWDSTRQPSN